MNQRLLWTTTALLTAALVTPSVAQARSRSIDQHPVKALQSTSTNTPRRAQAINLTKVEAHSPIRQTVKGTGIARVQPHQLQGRMAATLYVRNIPVLTFVGSSSTLTEGKSEFQQLNEPIWRASSVARQLNQLKPDGEDAGTIMAVWKPAGLSLNPDKHATRTSSNKDRYLIKVKGAVLVEIDSSTRLPDTISDPAKDALQATNRLRQLIGNAPPLNKISGKFVLLPKDKFLEQIAVGLVKMRLNGLASWYGADFHGKQTANGEIYDQYALTAAHRDLPFGTRVLVRNLQNNHSVVLRITDRGPYIAGRIIDVSTAAAGLLGMIQPGVVPVTVDVLSQEVPSRNGLIARSRTQNGQD